MLFLVSGCNEENDRNTDTPIAFQQDTSLMETFTVINMQEKTHKVTISPQKLSFHDVDQPIVIIHMFKDFDTATAYQIKTLNTLQKEKQKNLFVLSLQIEDNISTKALKAFIKKHKLTHFISNDIDNHHFQTILYESLSLEKKIHLPITILYTNDTYISHYTGAIPIEMLRYDIQQAIQD